MTAAMTLANMGRTMLATKNSAAGMLMHSPARGQAECLQ